MNLKLPIATAVLASALSLPAHAGLIGTELTLSTLLQATPADASFESSFPRVALVSASTVEFPNVASLFNPNDPKPPNFGSLVNTWIDAGDDYIEIDFHQAGSGHFVSAYQNTYVFQFDSAALATIVGAHLDDTMTTLGLSDADVTFSGNRLFVNVESLAFNAASFVRINLDVVGGPATQVPEPTALTLLPLALFAALAARRRPAGGAAPDRASRLLSDAAAC